MKICLVCEGVSETTQELCATCGRPLLDTRAVHFPRRRGEEDAANPLLGVVVDGKYRIHNVLGKGGMGTVFHATHEVSLVPVATKAKVLRCILGHAPGLMGLQGGDLRFENRWRDWLLPRPSQASRQPDK